jgi:hypothetical protein
VSVLTISDIQLRAVVIAYLHEKRMGGRGG